MKYLGQFSNAKDIVRKEELTAVENKTIQEISSQYIRITDLNPGIYKLTYNGTKYIYYNGSTSTNTTTVTEGSNGNAYTLLFVEKGDNKALLETTAKTWRKWFYINSNGSTYPTIYYGYTSSASGATSSKAINSLLTDISSYVKNVLTYSTSNTTYALSAYQGYLLNQNKEDKSNKVTSISSSSTDTEYPSAKCVYDAISSGGGGSSGIEIKTYTCTTTADLHTFLITLTPENIKEIVITPSSDIKGTRVNAEIGASSSYNDNTTLLENGKSYIFKLTKYSGIASNAGFFIFSSVIDTIGNLTTNSMLTFKVYKSANATSVGAAMKCSSFVLNHSSDYSSIYPRFYGFDYTVAESDTDYTFKVVYFD